MSKERKPVTITVKHTVHGNVIPEIIDFFEVTSKRARTMLTNELTRQGMSEDTVLVMGESGTSMTYELCNSMGETVDISNAYPNHRVVHLGTGELFVVRPNKNGRGRKSLVPFANEQPTEPITEPTPEPEAIEKAS